MPFKNLFPNNQFVILKQLPESSLPLLSLQRRFSCSSQPDSSNWVQNNQLFQRHPRLQLFEKGWMKTLHHLKQFVAYVFVTGLHRNPFIMSRILYLSLVESEECNRIENSEFGIQIFSRIKRPNIFSWNTLIRFFSGLDPMIALHFYTKMVRERILPDTYTFTFLLQAGGSSLDLFFVKQVHCHALKFGFNHNLFVQNSVLSAYAIRDSEMDARNVFDEMSNKDVITWTSLISGLVAHSNYMEALRVFKDLMADDSQPHPNVVTTISAMSACGGLGYANLTKCFHALLEKAGWIETDVSISNSLIDAYAKCGDLSNATRVLDEIQNVKKDLYSWTAVITAYGMHGRGLDALCVFSQMDPLHGLAPDAVTLVAILSACAHSGLLDQGLCIFELMWRRYKIKPDLRHYGCIVDLLGRAGMIKQAYSVVESMPMEPNLAVLGSLLSSCRLHNELEFGEAVLRKIELLKERGGASVLISNMYASKNEWGRVVNVRNKMRERIKGKVPGRSWIQVKDAVHEFVARNDVDPKLHMVLRSLEKLSTLFCLISARCPPASFFTGLIFFSFVQIFLHSAARRRRFDFNLIDSPERNFR
ncbi:putative pentatricopeptide repeat-containing protein At3g28640 isoform X1 [Salvia splendens]|uniref:putative pentatricopeptide repeat-containing protein At3g28640 isoform X1 n=1 Tax=Salvia splendens TaxID=180675 RepID=UPI001C26DB4B|nr:putative pentatricopeptide repeat-containing protein At3g28640 isoform X1 [Salvia splendens]XP_042016832.1 putative pentatricopeptide repeat-containing protein At3g28640 isoform X1 [Salvia splendens]XP_042016833.1 putative pentatricopeptide repeat-containing protein At3g28640 isoform X1 [Salvia splendens]XP_042016834.1 putative pentatricopeptide repeat-containing protein At3g28640 isoform X1 [Salvia splendens]XP_042016835.1 putative pentatricopeptide repeat-containing protein At3g28640 isofo